ncbi:MAG: hypothetical protein SHS37scaffold296_40 [Burkholderiales phage 68_11]|jgi:hypothetical protein|nr:MAG: hypothetical protein SHS37scaffold296_40 [Burkholderiales phage 68_11]
MSDWGFMTRLMPKVVAELKEWRQGGCGDHLDECWRNGVTNGLPGWFYAREGAVAVGTPFPVAWEGVALEMSLSAWHAHGYVLMLAPLPEGRRLVERPHKTLERKREILNGSN